MEDRPDIGNSNAPLNTRAMTFPRCATGYQNPDTLACVTPADVHWVEGTGFPNAATVGRNTLHTGGTNNFDLNLTKAIPLGETRRLELRWETFNAFNHPQFIQVPQKNVNDVLTGRFLNRDFTGQRHPYDVGAGKGGLFMTRRTFTATVGAAAVIRASSALAQTPPAMDQNPVRRRGVGLRGLDAAPASAGCRRGPAERIFGYRRLIVAPAKR